MRASLRLLHVAFALAATDTVMSQFQRLENRPRSNYRTDPDFFQLHPGQFANLSGNHRFAVFDRLNDSVELAMTKGMIRVKGTVFFDFNLTNLFRVVTAVVVYQKAPGVTKVLVNLGS
jgi:hypothetical protein